ncbi:MAG: Eco57I restriction-modification methylase domain-containing protein, partial [Vicinamibacterales bacterium]
SLCVRAGTSALGAPAIQPSGVSRCQYRGGMTGAPKLSIATRPALDSSHGRALAGVRPWWAARVRRAGLAPEWEELDFALVARPPAPLPELETSELAYDGWAMGTQYVNTLDADERAKHGRHYTPRDLAEHLWTMTRTALRFGVDPHAIPGLIRDPAVGAGALLIAPLREHLRASESVDPAFVLASLPNLIEGLDNDPWAVFLANVTLAAEMLPTLTRVPASLRRPLPALARVGDGLDPALPAAHSWIMNPPYGRQTLTAERREQFTDTLYGHANLYGMFMASALGRTDGDGAIAALVPTSFASGLYFHRLREQLAERAPLRSLTFVHQRNGIFGGVLQETCLAVFTPRRPRRVEISRMNGALSSVASVPSPRTSDPWLLPRQSSDAALAAAAASLPLTLSAAGWHASTGPLVWNRRRSDLHARSAADRDYIVWAADIDGGAIERDAKRNRHRYITLHGVADRGVMSLSTPAILVQRTTAPEQFRRLVVAELTPDDLKRLGGSVVVENHLNVLRPTVEAPLLSRSTLARVLSSRTLDRLMRCISGSVAVSSYELAALPLPDAETLASWEGLVGEDLERAIDAAYRPKARK